MAWIVLVFAAIMEVVWAISLKYSEGFTKLWPSVSFFVSAWISFACLSYALKTIPMGNAYAVWTGFGAVGITIAGIILFNESISMTRVICILLIVVGIIGLKLSSN
ncbi:DMT family transporter [Parashewanella tropica]|uniref:DMT family transporter n=1 Tax=Parashewanella tropica TaxID=2547970 RepID=UPI00105A44BC|nr:multidrug efflux SMR transporter [Parashewanella tropica]